ncbi:22049_t:CDS:1, partial [Cetraspora pellucida]
FKKKTAQNRMLIKNPTEDNPYIEEVKTFLTQKETQDTNMTETCLQEQETEEIILDYDIDSKTDTVCTEIPIENNLNTTQELVINNTNLKST